VTGEVQASNSQGYYEALGKVKVGEFLRREWEIKGLVHIGTNNGYEMEWYQKLGITPLLGVEPEPEAFKAFKESYPDIPIVNKALGNLNCTAPLYVSEDSEKSNCLEVAMDTCEHLTIDMRRWATLVSTHEVNPTDYNCCVIDVQGMELDVLRGMDEHLDAFEFLVVECSARPIFSGEASAEEVVAFLAKRSWRALNPASPHDDILFVKNPADMPTKEWLGQAIPAGNKLNCGSGQRPFDQAEGWVNMDLNPRWNPDFVGDWNDLSAWDDNSMELVVSHHSLEHVGCGEATGFIKESYRVLQPEGSLLIFVPDMKALAQRWLLGQIDDYTYMVNVYGAYMDDEADRHKWSWSYEGWVHEISEAASWSTVQKFGWRMVSGADLSRDWWILAIEVIK
jgi:FkbM family methyltransferase